MQSILWQESGYVLFRGWVYCRAYWAVWR